MKMTTEPKSLADLIREADGACPCRINIGVMCNDECGHAPASLRLQSIMSNAPCEWVGHAAIRAVVRKCAEEAQEYAKHADPAPSVNTYSMGRSDGAAEVSVVILSALREVDGE